MKKKWHDHSSYTPVFHPEAWSRRDLHYLSPFASNPNSLVSTLHNLPPEIIGALCSRASRAKGSLLRILLNEYIYPILEGEDKKLAAELEGVVNQLHRGGFKKILNNQRAYGFYVKWLSQYGDDSIAQMTGTHLIFWGISQVSMKYIEDQRIGLEPIEKSTRYVNFGERIRGHYLYYTPGPDLRRLGLLKEYRTVMDNLFKTYNALLPRIIQWLKQTYDEKDSVLEKKAFDSLRGLLPMATLGQVAFRGNAQAFEYLLSRLRKHELGEFRWIAAEAKTALDEDIPSLLLRLEEEKSETYQTYLAENSRRIEGRLSNKLRSMLSKTKSVNNPKVRLVEYDKHVEEKIITGVLFALPHTRTSWKNIMQTVHKMSMKEKELILESVFKERRDRWYKLGRAFENADFRFEITMDIGAYRDLHRHRMLTQERQLFGIHLGYNIPQEVKNAGLEQEYRRAVESVQPLYKKLAKQSPVFAQYVVPLAYRIRFYQKQNASSLFWETELRSGSQGHPDYRHIEHEKYKLVTKVCPVLAKHMRVDLNRYTFARREDTERIAKKEQGLLKRKKKR